MFARTVQLLVVVLALASAALAEVSTPPTPVPPTPAPPSLIEEYGRLLAIAVDSKSGLVDYKRLAAMADALSILDRFAASTLPANAQVDEKLAGKINRYNARVLERATRNLAVISAAPNGVLSDPEFFKRPYQLEGKALSLNDYESTIRALAVPAAHFGVNCASNGCPRLIARPFEAATVRAELKRLELESILAATRRQASAKPVVLEVIEIYFWYGKDFTGKDPEKERDEHVKGLKAYLSKALADAIATGDQAAARMAKEIAAAATIVARSDWNWKLNAR